jgi:class 3 adenylate cyclase/tetratricopeptide (TPR) repeat protein
MAQELPEGTVTILFTDVEASTDLLTRRGDEAAQEILRAQRELVRAQVKRHSGHEVKSLGDGFMVAFASARKAVACAVGIQRALEQHNRHQPREQVRVRIGLNTGEVIQEEEDLFGEAVNAAARIAAKARGGQILLSETVRGVLGRAKDVELVDRGRFRLKGFPERWHLYEVAWQEEAAAGPVAPPPLLDRTPFVGRESERADLQRLLDQAVRGQGALVMIGGEAGVGKTRLAEELLLEARQRGVLAWTGHCHEMEGAPPYVPFVEILETAARAIPAAALRDALGDSAPEVARLLPGLRRLFPDIPPPLELPPEQERRYLFNCVLEFLQRAAQRQPLLLTLEDLHWGDDSTLLLLQHITQRLHEMAVLILGTYRDVELDVARPLAEALRELTRQRLAHDLALKRLPEAGVEAMLRALSGQEPPGSLVREVYRETEGNPFFVEEVFKYLAEEGKLLDEQGRWRADLSISELEVPRSIRLVIGQRLERLSEPCHRALTSAAVIGRAFSFELLEALGDPSASSGQAPSASSGQAPSASSGQAPSASSGQAPSASSGQAPSAGSGRGVEADALLDAIDEAERAHLIASTADGPEARFTFAHELIRQTLVSGLSLPRRQRLHLRVAEAIERVYLPAGRHGARTLEEHAGDLAHHLYQAGTAAEPEKTAHYLMLAGERAMEATAFEDALRHYEDALALQPAEDRRARADLLFKRGQALRSLGRWEEVLDDWREALDTYEKLADAKAVARVCYELSGLLGYAARWDEAVEVARRGLGALGQQVSADRCRLAAAAGWNLSLGGDYAGGDAMLTEGLAMAEGLGDRHLLGLVLSNKAGVHMWHLQLREALDAGLRAAELLRSAGDLWVLVETLYCTQYALGFLGRFDEAARITGEVEPLAERLGHLGTLLAVRRGSSLNDLILTGDIDRFEEFARADLELCRSADMPWISNTYTYLGLAHFWRGRWDQALESFREAARLEPPGMVAGYDWAGLFLCQGYMGDKDAALAALEERREGLPRPGGANSVGAWAMVFGAVEGLAVLGEREEAAKLYPLLLEVVNSCALVTWDWALPQSLAGMAAAAGGQWEKAEEHYETALRQAHEIPVVIEQPEVRRWYARMLIDRARSEHPEPVEGRPSKGSAADLEKARQLLTEAIAMYRRIGMPKHVEMAEEMLGEL